MGFFAALYHFTANGIIVVCSSLFTMAEFMKLKITENILSMKNEFQFDFNVETLRLAN
jgi:hypothetical protein